MWTPIDAIFRGGDSSHTPVSPSMHVASTPNAADRPDDRLLEVAAVLLHVASVPLEVEDRVADELPGAVVGRLAAAVGLDDLDLGALGDVELARLGAPAERDRRRVLEQEHRVRDRALRRRRRPATAAAPTPRDTARGRGSSGTRPRSPPSRSTVPRHLPPTARPAHARGPGADAVRRHGGPDERRDRHDDPGGADADGGGDGAVDDAGERAGRPRNATVQSAMMRPRSSSRTSSCSRAVAEVFEAR